MAKSKKKPTVRDSAKARAKAVKKTTIDHLFDKIENAVDDVKGKVRGFSSYQVTPIKKKAKKAKKED